MAEFFRVRFASWMGKNGRPSIRCLLYRVRKECEKKTSPTSFFGTNQIQTSGCFFITFSIYCVTAITLKYVREIDGGLVDLFSTTFLKDSSSANIFLHVFADK